MNHELASMVLSSGFFLQACVSQLHLLDIQEINSTVFTSNNNGSDGFDLPDGRNLGKAIHKSAGGKHLWVNKSIFIGYPC